MTIEIIVLVVVLAFVASRFLATRAPAPQSIPVAPKAAPALRAVLQVEGTDSFAGDRSFVKQFGISPAAVKDVRIARGFADILRAPAAVQGCLKSLCSEGNTRGPEVARLAAGLEPLPSDKAIYFVLHDNNMLTAFMDVAR